MMETLPIIIIFFKKNLKINLAKVVKAFNSEIFKSLEKKKRLKTTLDVGKTFHVLRLVESILCRE